MQNYDAILFVSFGAPELPEEVMPFLRNVVRGRGVPDERLAEVAGNYTLFGGKSPLNEQNKQLIAALEKDFAENGLKLPIYFGNRNWHPFLAEAIAAMKKDGVKRALAFVTSAYSSYSGCRQYRENIENAKLEADAGDIQIDKIRVFYNHPNFIAVNAENLQNALHEIPEERRAQTPIVFTAHSLPLAQAKNCDYEAQLTETAQLVMAEISRESGVGSREVAVESSNSKSTIRNPKTPDSRLPIPDWKLVFQSRSGAPQVPWLAPDILDYLRELKSKNVKDVVVQPIGFISDHQEVIFDLDTQAQQLASELGLNLVRAKTAGTHPKFVEMIRELIMERLDETREKRFLGTRGAKEDFCPANCCLNIQRPR